MKYLLVTFLCLLSSVSYSQTSDSLLYIRCRNFQNISDSSLTINVLSKTEVKIWKDITQKNILFIEPKEEGTIKIALTNAENDTVQVMNYKTVFLPIPKIRLIKDSEKNFSISLSEKNQRILVDGLPDRSATLDDLIDKQEEMRYRTNHFSAYLKRENETIDSVFIDSPIIDISSLMKKAKKGDTIKFAILNIQRMNYERKKQDIPLNIEFEYIIEE